MVVVPADVVVVVEGRWHAVAGVEVHDAAWGSECVDSFWVEGVRAFEGFDVVYCSFFERFV